MILDKKIPFGYILNKIKYDLLLIVITGLVTQFLTNYYHDFLPVMPLAIPTFLGTAISVLLSFKMSQSYDRWWEARKVWGAIVNDSRSFVLQLQAFLKSEHQDVIRLIAYRQIAWCYVLGQSLRGLPPLDNTDALLSQQDKEELQKHNNKALGILQLNTLTIRQLKSQNDIDVFTHVELDKTLVRLCDAMGKAERINTTVFPATYRYFLHFIIYVFVVILSIALREVQTIFELPLLVVISISFFLIEKSAYHLQDPFRDRPSDTPVTTIARNIEINIRQLLGESEIPAPIQPAAFYIK